MAPRSVPKSVVPQRVDERDKNSQQAKSRRRWSIVSDRNLVAHLPMLILQHVSVPCNICLSTICNRAIMSLDSVGLREPVRYDKRLSTCYSSMATYHRIPVA